MRRTLAFCFAMLCCCPLGARAEDKPAPADDVRVLAGVSLLGSLIGLPFRPVATAGYGYCCVDGSDGLGVFR